MEIKPQDSTEKNLQTLRSPGILGIVAISKETVWNNPNVVIVPAYEGNSEVRILPKPAFFTVDHGITFISYVDPGKDKLPYPIGTRGKPVFYAAYLSAIEDIDGLRFIIMPVALLPEGKGAKYNQDLIREMGEQGFPVEAIQANCRMEDVEQTFSYLDARYLPSFRYILKGKGLLVQAPHPESDRITLQSGWSEGTEPLTGIDELTMIGNPNNFRNRTNYYEQGIYNHFGVATSQNYDTGLKVISEPFSSERADQFSMALYQKVLTANR